MLNILYYVALALLILWLIGQLGIVSAVANLLGSFIHLLLVIAIILVLIRIIRGKKPWG